ncbi:hypothetical protein PQ478_08490 [Alkalihalophilus pseudofirmus]|uniref:hypothetical protein n=1 Tax=Alkalihalophilus pseudofirmus TaxID=79885 RepID=UPI00259B69B3|nr:hypothetical protein [Alkalihalophilus pseudofirmus]WEG18506.1 hypothetical protein PQ478_08490 [Alkalihalophilus pseudofirmus]
MARRTTKATEKKTVTKVKETPELENEVVETAEEPVSKPTPKPKKLTNTDYVTIMNNTSGLCIYKSKRTGNEWRFTEYGQMDEIEFGELMTMKNSQGRFLTEPWLLVLDDEAVQRLGLKRLYENVLDPEDVEEVFEMDAEDIKGLLAKLPRGMAELVLEQAKVKITNGTLDSLAKIDVLEKHFKVTLKEL